MAHLLDNAGKPTTFETINARVAEYYATHDRYGNAPVEEPELPVAAAPCSFCRQRYHSRCGGLVGYGHTHRCPCALIDHARAA